ncbi:MAG: HupE/UreJ family protein [Acidimicrobiia bacterium]|nr:HupE/UreJ family protein [Acidimicrobiia bacterium]
MPRRLLAALAAALLLAPAAVRAHDVPNDVVVNAFLKPEGQLLRLVIRVPLEAMRDTDLPMRGPGYLDLTRAEQALRDATTVWIARELELYEGDTRLTPSALAAVRVSLPSDTSFREYETALAHVHGPPLAVSTDLYWNQGMLDALIEYPIQSDASRFSIRPRLERLGLQVTVALRLVRPDGVVRAFEIHGDPGVLRLDPTWGQAAWSFVVLGFEHILSGADHLLFLLCLVIPLRRVRTLVAVVTAFTLAHSVTLIASAYELAPSALWFPPLVETLIATSIVYMALENIVGARTERRWLITLAFGLVHGFGFSFALRETLQFAGTHLLVSLLAFNVGVELGQLLVLAIALPALAVLFRAVVAERMGTIILSAFVAHTGWHWMTERGQQLMQFSWPGLDAATLADIVWWVMVAVAVIAVAWLARASRQWKEKEA